MRITCKTKDTLPLEALTEFQGGLKKREEADFEKIQKSIEKYGFATPFFVWTHGSTNHVLDGHGRLETLKRMQADGEEIPPLPVVYVDCKTEADAKNLLLRINSTYGKMTAETIADFLGDLEIDLDEIKLPDGVLDLTPIDKKEIDDTKRSLREQFLVPPFSVLDTRQGYWQDRKRQWKLIGIKSDDGRNIDMMQPLVNLAEKVNGKSTLAGLSIFDPVLCETLYTWFCKPDGVILDPFAGGSVRGIVASYKQMQYTGFDIRPEQIAANLKQLKICDGNKYAPQWITHDSAKMGEVLDADYKCDLVFSCPPYADLEKYSDLEGDISNKPYNEFLELYRKIIAESCARLKDNRFAIFVISEVRDPKSGNYRNFIADTIKAFEDCGLHYYNELILVNVAGSKAYSAGHDAKQSRKIARTHQNALVFTKGDTQETCRDFEKALVFLKGDWRAATKELGAFVADNCVLPELEE